MILPKAKKIAKEQRWHKTNDKVFGLYQGYFFNVYDSSVLSNPQFKFVQATTGILTEDQKQQIQAALNTRKKQLKFNHYEMGPNHILFQFLETPTFTKINTIYALLDFLVELFKTLHISEQKNCHECGSNQKLDYYNLNDTGIILCAACKDQAESNFREIERQRILEEKNYLTGFVGAVLFSIPGIIAWVIIAVYLERLGSAMAFVIAFLGIKGYDYFKGTQGKLTKFIIVITNIISILLANLATVLTLLVKEGLTLEQSIHVYQSNEAAKEVFYENTTISFVLAVIVWIWLLFGMKDLTLSIKPADKMEGN